MRGNAHRALGDDAAAENDYIAAATLAATRGATGEELQAITRLTHLLDGQERGADVYDRLRVVLGSVGGEESADVAEANQLHRRLSAPKGQDR